VTSRKLRPVILLFDQLMDPDPHGRNMGGLGMVWDGLGGGVGRGGGVHT